MRQGRGWAVLDIVVVAYSAVVLVYGVWELSGGAGSGRAVGGALFVLMALLLGVGAVSRLRQRARARRREAHGLAPTGGLPDGRRSDT